LQHREAAVTELQADGNQLEIVLGMEKWAASVKFDVSKFHLRQLVPVEKLGAADPMVAARARAKALDRKSLNEALQSAAHGNDIAFLKALLEAGADPKYASKAGWTALMVAAAYGTADMVDALVEAGSDVNACDKNCGGQSVLMWAVHGGREPKRKVQSLLKAGANKERTDEGGYNLLMSAASSGDLPTVELLLQAGMKPAYQDKEGSTVLMVGSRNGGEKVVRRLIEAGADVNAKDNKGMTPLMYAVDGYNAADTVKLLLEAGTNPNAKDKKGRTALRIAKESNHVGAEQAVVLLKAVTKE
jgi:ankyrin repeat protein